MAQSTFDVCVRERAHGGELEKKMKKKIFANFYIAWSITVKQRVPNVVILSACGGKVVRRSQKTHTNYHNKLIKLSHCES